MVRKGPRTEIFYIIFSINSLFIEATGARYEFQAENKDAASDWVGRLKKLQNYLSITKWNQKMPEEVKPKQVSKQLYQKL